MTGKWNWKKLFVIVSILSAVLLINTTVFADGDSEERVNGEYEITADGTLIYHAGWYGEGYGKYKLSDSEKNSVETVVVEKGAHFSGSIQSMFYHFPNVRSINLSNADMSLVTSMSHMFADCTSLEALDLSSVDTSQVTSMESMFMGCKSLRELDLSGLDTSNVRTMFFMFLNDEGLESINITGIDTSKVTNMRALFGGCKSLQELDLSTFSTEKAVAMDSMFLDCSSLKSLDLSSFNTQKAKSMTAMFSGCTSLETIDLSSFNTSNVTMFQHMFEGCSAMKTIDLSSIDTANSTLFRGMFSGCSSLEAIDLSGFNTSSATKIKEIFKDCISLRRLDLSGFDLSMADESDGLFSGCSQLETIVLPTQIHEIGENSFSGCDRLKTVCFPGSQQEWESVVIGEGNENLFNAIMYYDIAPGEIVQQPMPQCVSEGNTAVFQVDTEGTIISYCWQYKIKGKNRWYDCSSKMEGYNTSRLQVIGALSRDGYKYRCVVTDYRGISTISDEALLSVVEPSIIIIDGPQSTGVEAGRTASFSVLAEGNELTYRWQYKIKGKTTWYNCSPKTAGYDTPELHIVGTPARDGYQYRCVITDVNGYSVTSAAAKLTVTEPSLRVIGQPESITVTEGETAHFMITTEGSGLAYQWQYKIKGSNTWRNSSPSTFGYNTRELHITATAARNGYQYRCIVTDDSGNTEISSAATLTVISPGPKINADPQNQTVAAGETAHFTVAATGDGLTYQWQYKAAESRTWRNSSPSTTGYNSAELEVVGTAARNGFQYRCKVTDKNGETVTSRPVTLTVE